MGRLLGLMLFSAGLGLVLGLLIKSQVIVIVLSAVFLLLGYHLFCR